MTFFRRLKKHFYKNKPSITEIKIFAPISGEIVPLEDVPDIVFAEKIIGDGLAINPTSNKLVAPCNGIVSKIFETNHAITFLTEDEIELFIHIGIDTVEQKGEGFKRIVEENQKVIKGETLIEIDLPLIKRTAKSTLTPIIISNMHIIKQLKKKTGKVNSAEHTIITITK